MMTGIGERHKDEITESAAWPALSSGASLPDRRANSALRSPRATNHPARRLRMPSLDTARIAAAVRTASVEEREYGHLFLFIPVFMGIGAALWYVPASDPPVFAIALFLAVTAWPAFRARYAQKWTALVAGGLVFVPIGMLLAAFESHRLSTVMLDTAVTTNVTGRVLSRETDDRGRMRYRVELTQTRDPVLKRPPETVTLLARSAHETAAIGAFISGRARLSPPSGPALPGLNDFAFDAYFAGTGAVGFFYGRPSLVAGPDGDQNLMARVKQRIATWRSGLGDHIRGRIGGDAGAIAAALVTGEERAIGTDTVEALRQAGLAHVLAISGLNMVLAAGTFLIGARTILACIPGFAERYPAKKLAAAGALVMVTLYILVSGGAVSAIRAWIMISVMLVAALFGRTAISLRNLAISAIIILAVTPSAVTGPGFQMSYAATLGLVAGYAVWRERPMRRERPRGATSLVGGALGRFFGGLLLSSLIGGFATLIYSIGHFHRIPAYGLVGNLVAMPVISVLVMPFGLIAVLLIPFGLDTIPFAIMGKGIEWMISLSYWVAGWGGEVVTGRIAPLAFLLIALGGGIVCMLRTWLRHCASLMIAAGCLVAFLPDGRPAPEVLISEDGRLVAFINGASAATNRERPPDFIYAQWQRALRLKNQVTPVVTRKAKQDRGAKGDTTPGQDAEAARKSSRKQIDEDIARKDMTLAVASARTDARFHCRAREWCAAVSPSGWRLVAIEEPAYIGAACDSADIVIAPQHLRIAGCRSGARLITARMLRRSGALEIRPATGSAASASSPYDFSSAVHTLERPWSHNRTYDWRSGLFEPGGNPFSDSAE